MGLDTNERRYVSQSDIRRGLKSVDDQIRATRIQLTALLNEYLDTRHINSFLRAGGKIVLKEMRNRVPVDTGQLKESLAMMKFKGDINSIYIGARYYSRVNIEGENVSKIGPHAHLVEFGFIDRSGQRVKGKPFVKPTFVATKATSEAAIIKAIEKFQKQWEGRNSI